LKKVSRQSKGGSWRWVSLAAFALLSLTLTFFVLSFTGSPIVGQITAALKGQKPPVNDINGTPVQKIPNVVLTVPPAQTKEIAIDEKPITDTLDAGVSHEYNFNARSGRDLYIYIQFVSPAAQNVAPNVAVLRPDGANAKPSCQMDRITRSGADITLICPVSQPGVWKVRIFGITGQSTGVYFISASQG
jgi:hypothetical protein